MTEYKLKPLSTEFKKKGFICDFMIVDEKTGKSIPASPANFVAIMNGRSFNSLVKDFE